MSAPTLMGEVMETAVIRSQAQVVEENAEAGTGDGALPGVVDPRSVAPRDARQLSRQFFQRLTELEEGTHEYQYARNTLIEMNMSLVRFAAGRFRGRGDDMEDIVQTGMIGLIRAKRWCRAPGGVGTGCTCRVARRSRSPAGRW
ncbi:hypothetical protein SVIOM74S_01394 [Streptomyces violarus]